MGDWATWSQRQSADSSKPHSGGRRTNRRRRKTKRKKAFDKVPVFILDEILPGLFHVLTPQGKRELVKADELQLFELDSGTRGFEHEKTYIFPLMAYVQKHNGNLLELYRSGTLVDTVFVAMEKLLAQTDSATIDSLST